MSGDHAHCRHPKISDIRNSELSVGDVMVRRPKTMPASASVADLRRTFANPHVVSALLVDGACFAGLVNRVDVPDAVRDDAPARDFADVEVVTVRPSTPLPEAVKALDMEGSRRLVVVADDGRTLEGLLCLDESRSSFCR